MSWEDQDKELANVQGTYEEDDTDNKNAAKEGTHQETSYAGDMSEHLKSPLTTYPKQNPRKELQTKNHHRVDNGSNLPESHEKPS